MFLVMSCYVIFKLYDVNYRNVEVKKKQRVCVQGREYALESIYYVYIQRVYAVL